MRLLVINPNSSAAVTRRIDAAAQRALLPGESVTTIAAPFGPELIVTPQDARRAEAAVMSAMAERGAGSDGIILASFGDTGLVRVRAGTSVPVVGIARAAFSVAQTLGDRFAIVSFSPSVAPSLHRIVECYGLSGALAALHCVEGHDWSDPGAIQDELRGPITALCAQTARAGTARSIVLGGGPLAGLAPRIAPEVPAPLIDGTAAAVAMLRSVLARG